MRGMIESLPRYQYQEFRGRPPGPHRPPGVFSSLFLLSCSGPPSGAAAKQCLRSDAPHGSSSWCLSPSAPLLPPVALGRAQPQGMRCLGGGGARGPQRPAHQALRPARGAYPLGRSLDEQGALVRAPALLLARVPRFFRALHATTLPWERGRGRDARRPDTLRVHHRAGGTGLASPVRTVFDGVRTLVPRVARACAPDHREDALLGSYA